MKAAVSVPAPLFLAADARARALHISRSELYRRALQRFVSEAAADDVNAAVERIYAEDPALLGLDPALELASEEFLARDAGGW